jgi:hypothetical protein
MGCQRKTSTKRSQLVDVKVARNDGYAQYRYCSAADSQFCGLSMHWIESPSTGTLIGILGILIGAGVSYYFYRRGLRIKRLAYDIWSVTIISNRVASLPDLDIQYQGLRVENLSVSRLALWNDGTTAILNSDIPRTDPLRVDITQGKIIRQASIITTTERARQIDCTVSSNGQHIYVTFPFLEKEQGVVIEIIHDGTRSDDLSLGGLIIDGEPHLHSDLENKHGGALSGMVVYGGMAVCISIIFILLHQLPQQDWYPYSGSNVMPNHIALIGLGILVGIATVMATVIFKLLSLITDIQEQSFDRSNRGLLMQSLNELYKK